MPPAALFVYFLVVSVIVRIAISIYEIPSASLVPELTDNYDERTSLISYRFFFGWWGGLGMTVLAYAIFLQPDALHPVGVLNPDGIPALRSHRGDHDPRRDTRLGNRHAPLHPVPQEASGEDLLESAESSASSARRFRTARSSRSSAPGCSPPWPPACRRRCSIYVNTYFWELTSSQISRARPQLVRIGGDGIRRRADRVPAVRKEARGDRRVARRRSPSVPLPILLRLLDLFPANASPALMPMLFVFNLVTITLVIMSGILGSSMIADIVEDSELSTGRRSEGVFVAANAFVQKAVSGIGIFSSTMLLAVIGFPSDAQARRGRSAGGAPASGSCTRRL